MRLHAPALRPQRHPRAERGRTRQELVTRTSTCQGSGSTRNHMPRAHPIKPLYRTAVQLVAISAQSTHISAELVPSQIAMSARNILGKL